MRGLLVCSLGGWLIATSFSTQAEEPKAAPSSVVMAKKLEYSQDMLQALMNDDFERLERDVKLMHVFTRLEEMYRAKRPEYQEQFTKFRDSVTALTAAIEKKDEEAASLAYGGMVQSCIRCHRLIRDK